MGLPADGRATRGFTLTELLAVLAIMLIVVAGSVSVWLALAGAVAPGHATAVVQAMLAGAREYAVSNGKMTRVVFVNSLANVERGTTMYFEYDESPGTAGFQPKRIPGRASQDAGKQVFILKDSPDLSSVPVPAVAADAANPNASDVAAWQNYREAVIKKLASYAFTNVNAAGYLGATSNFNTGQDKFYVTFDPVGTLSLDVAVANPLSLTVIQIGGTGRRVSEYEFYLLNANTGAQLVFE
jgi:prepilin-type N-terminal cleavage/methylation domain-containing protein